MNDKRECNFCKESINLTFDPIFGTVGYHSSFDLIEGVKRPTIYHKNCWRALMRNLRHWARLFPAGTRNYGT